MAFLDNSCRLFARVNNKARQKNNVWLDFFGAGGGSRTLMTFRSPVFETGSYTYFDTPATSQ